MDLSNAQQTAALLWSLLFGVGLGAAFDLLRMWRVFVPCGAVAMFFQDLIWFFFAAAASFAFIFEVNDGTVRFFILAAFLAGGLFWRATAGWLLLRFCRMCKKKKTEHAEKRRMKRQNKIRQKSKAAPQ